MKAGNPCNLKTDVQGSNFKLSPFLFYLKTCLNCTNFNIFLPNKKQIPAV